MFSGQAVHVAHMMKCVVIFLFTCVYVLIVYLYVCIGVSIVYGVES